MKRFSFKSLFPEFGEGIGNFASSMLVAWSLYRLVRFLVRTGEIDIRFSSVVMIVIGVLILGFNTGVGFLIAWAFFEPTRDFSEATGEDSDQEPVV